MPSPSARRGPRPDRRTCCSPQPPCARRQRRPWPGSGVPDSGSSPFRRTTSPVCRSSPGRSSPGLRRCCSTSTPTWPRRPRRSPVRDAIWHWSRRSCTGCCGRRARSRPWRRTTAVLLGGSAAPLPLLKDAREVGVRVVTTYGMSETCGGCVYDGMALDGVAVAVDADGAIRLGGPVLFDGYEGRPDLTARVLRDGWFHTRISGGWTTTDDWSCSGAATTSWSAAASTCR